MAIELKKKRSANPVTALSNGLEEDLQRQGYGVGTIWKQRRLFNDLLLSLIHISFEVRSTVVTWRPCWAWPREPHGPR